MIRDSIAAACTVWYLFIILVSATGVYQIRRSFRSTPFLPFSNTALAVKHVPHITIIRPVKDAEPYLYECLLATFLQKYPREKTTVCFCVSSRNDLALPILERLITDYQSWDAKILVEEEDPNLSGRDGHTTNLGPNPKIRNMSRAYREARGDIVWIVDCNVWVGPAVARQMVDLLCGFTTGSTSPSEPHKKGRKYKFVHQLPLVMDVSQSASYSVYAMANHSPSQTQSNGQQKAGGLLEEMFLSTSHAKFYTAINTVAIAPCIVGKSNMFRRSHLNALTSPSTTTKSTANIPSRQLHQPGIDYFSSNICEDHLIGDLLWKAPVPPSIHQHAFMEGLSLNDKPAQPMADKEWKWGNHALLPPHPTNLAIQPFTHLPLSAYLSRRTRWLRVRKFTVPLATLVEPGTESFLCSFYGAYGLTTLPWCHDRFGIPQTWAAFWVIWLLSVVVWGAVDWCVYGMLQSTSIAEGEAPPFAARGNGKRKGIGTWAVTWLGREVLAFPIWAWAFIGGVSVQWRGRRFIVGVDMRVREIRQGDLRQKEVKNDRKGRRE